MGGTPSLAERLAKAKLVLMPINDKDDPEAHSGGSHWSLLSVSGRVVDRRAAI